MQDTHYPSEQSGARLGRPALPVILLGLLILAYAAFFSAYTLQRHATLNTFAADLSFIDQPMWNTLHGRFLERTLGAVQAPRVAEHFEPILLPLSLIYLVWDDVRAMLIVQTLALALGALPVFWIARRAFRHRGRLADWLALAFSLAYLIAPSLQAANVADFHADPLVVAPLLFAFWFGTERRWRPMWAWAIVVMAGKENMPTLTAMLGLFLIVSDPDFRAAWRARPGHPSFAVRLRAAFAGGAKHGLALFAVSVTWFLVATFLIVAPLARQYYGTDGPIYLAHRYAFSDGLGGILAALRQPARLDYLRGQFGAVGWLALLAPEYLLIGLPILIANTFSNFSGQYSGEQHYSAPLVAVFIVAAIYGARRLQDWIERQIPVRLTPKATNAQVVSVLGLVWLLVWAGSAQVERGWTPFARPFQWPAYTAHHAALGDVLSQAPADAAVSATAAVHPHLAHREKIYVFPALGDATHVLVDVPGVTDVQATDLKATIDRLLSQDGFGVVTAVDGYLLLAQGQGRPDVLADFYTFAQANLPDPHVPAQAQFGPGLRFEGYDVVDDARRRLTHFHLYFTRLSDDPLPANLEIRYTARDPSGLIVDDSRLRPMPAAVWYPPSAWARGQTVVYETVPWFLPRAVAPVLTVTSGSQTVRAELVGDAARLALGPAKQVVTAAVAPDGSLRLGGLARRSGRLELYEGALYPVVPVEDAAFAGANWSVRLREWSAPFAVAPGVRLPVLLYWQAARPADQDYSVFLHLRDATNETEAWGDGQPTWFTPLPASTWQVGGDGLGGTIDARALYIPSDLPPGRYDLVVGWYDSQTGARLARTTGLGNRAGDEFVLGAVTVDPLAGPRPDACCLAAEECCASAE